MDEREAESYVKNILLYILSLNESVTLLPLTDIKMQLMIARRYVSNAETFLKIGAESLKMHITPI